MFWMGIFTNFSRQAGFPVIFYSLIAVEPVFSNQWYDFRFDHPPIPFVMWGDTIPGTKIAVADPVAWAEILGIGRNGFVQESHPFYDSAHKRWRGTQVFQKRLERLALEFRLERDEAKPAAECVIHHRQRPVSSVHHADNVQIVRDIELVCDFLRVSQRDGVLRSPLVWLNQHHQLTKNLAQVATIDLVDNENMRLPLRLVSLRPATELVKDSVF